MESKERIDKVEDRGGAGRKLPKCDGAEGFKFARKRDTRRVVMRNQQEDVMEAGPLTQRVH